MRATAGRRGITLGRFGAASKFPARILGARPLSTRTVAQIFWARLKPIATASEAVRGGLSVDLNEDENVTAAADASDKISNKKP